MSATFSSNFSACSAAGHPGVAASVVSIDLEVGRDSGRIHRFAGVHGKNGRPVAFPPGTLSDALRALDGLADEASYLLGHNLLAFDLPQLRAAQPNLRLLGKDAIDTLRLNPLAFPRNPYHHLVKHHHDGCLLGNCRNDPLLDAELALQVFADQIESLTAMAKEAPDLLLAWHWLTTEQRGVGGLDHFFTEVRGAARPHASEAEAAMMRLLDDAGCTQARRDIIARAPQLAWPLAYALAWISVAGGDSVMPPWVRHQFPETGRLIRQLRDTPCGRPDCRWCEREHSALRQLQYWFGKRYTFRPEPVHSVSGRPLQQEIVEAAMRGEHSLGILPTGTGKSLCYQVPALSRFARTGALSIVISPLVALMEDQVNGLRARDIQGCAAINGLLSMPERADVLDRVRLGDVSILLIAPEQLRNKGVRKVLAQREIGAWIFDEAHCLSKWGQDFRPDYRYVARFIRENAEASPGQEMPLIQCLTATAKPEVVADIVGHFRERLGVELRVFPGGAKRDNLDFEVIETTEAEKFTRVAALIERELPADAPGGAIVYCATRKQVEEMAIYLCNKGHAAAAYHAKLPPERKKDTQHAFIAGKLRVIAATNAFGMGIDKPDVRLVVHADIPGSLENYLQEAGRAGRDRAQARSVLLYSSEDVERQHGMSAASRLSRRDIQGVLRALRQLQRKKDRDHALVATPAEILEEDQDGKFKRDGNTDDTRVRTAIAWLEEAGLVRREENAVQVFASSLRVRTAAEAERLLGELDAPYRQRCLRLVELLLAAGADDGLSTDELMAAGGFSADLLRETLFLFDRLGIASNDMAMTAFVHVAVENSSKKRLRDAAVLEAAVIAALREDAPDFGVNDTAPLHLRLVTQRLKDQGYTALPQRVRQIIAGLAGDGRDGEEGKGSLTVKRGSDPELLHVTLNRPWRLLERIAERRRNAAERLLDHWLSALPQGARGVDQLAETTIGQLAASVASDALLAADTKDMRKLVERGLLWLHEQEVLRLNKGLTIFRPAMTLHLESNWKLQFEKSNYQALALHYEELTRQIHIMAEYAERGIRQMADAVQLALDYFTYTREEFCRRWLPGRESELTRQTTPQSWETIVDTLARPHQRNIVADDRDSANVLVLAGPGSGKTRVLVHRIAYLIRMRRENPQAVLALAYNRHAALEIRKRLAALIGDDARGVTVLTCHALAMRLVGASFVHRGGEEADFDGVLSEATALLEGRGLPPEDADAQRDRLLAGFRWILVDEYQDIGPGQYALIAALAGRKRSDEDGRLNLFAVGDDDQNIYAFAGASIEYIRRYTEDYKARQEQLVENYRSTRHIVAVANLVIGRSKERMKQQAIRVNAARANAAPGGVWQQVDPVTQGRVQILPTGRNADQQALAIYTELRRMMALGLDLARTAVIARQWKYLDPVRAALEAAGIPVSMADEEAPSLWRLRETQALLAYLEGLCASDGKRLLKAGDLQSWLAERDGSCWWRVLREAVDAFVQDTQEAEVPLAYFQEWLAEWGRASRLQQDGILLLTAHRAKGLEFDHVFVLDGDWRNGQGEDADAARRLYYVAMTRAKATLTLANMEPGNPMIDTLGEHACLVRRPPISWLPAPGPLERRFHLPGQRDLKLSFAGWKEANSIVHRAIANLRVGDRLSYVEDEQGARLMDETGVVVGRFSKNFRPPVGMRCVLARVRAVVVWRKCDNAPEFQARCQRDRWEVVLPELVFER
ncbi:RecQ family ATP-dependent DNA helicase [Pseudoduganella chitinolytica]|uniref:DNA 3'-5' helicase n=1 Tax=Pseudoduganella chitinolytica TaxID=34070 RepID=A0ABY8BEG8_9BURK|nr:RecQ family ATP-dependent DNA helicase [Pseudoduganella chitinolytica]WEF32724.1 RecQ family ATP-dependent DNA helicase [Pseudoduganella chitinolytica]